MSSIKYIAIALALFSATMPNCTPTPPPGEGEGEGEGDMQVEGQPELEGALEGEPAPAGPELFGYTEVNVYPHDENAFTQGLQYVDGYFYESTGQYGESSVREVIPETGGVLSQRDLDARYFGEGLAVVGDEIVQLTWREKTAFVYHRGTLAVLRTHSYDTEGWGLTHDGEEFIMSDGSHRLYFRDSETFELTRTIEVLDRGDRVRNLNELEYIDGAVYANVWQSDRIARIDPETGVVTAWIDLEGLVEQAAPGKRPGVLNGIAYDAEGDRLFVTGKNWPRLYEIGLVPKE
jgi:glutaminyl-peptide cyclotransferase